MIRFFQKSYIPFLIIFAAGVLAFDFGLFLGGDNFSYMILSQSIAKFGAYRNIHLPGNPHHVLYPPIYPLVLCLFHFFLRESIIFPKLLNLFLLVIASFFFARILNLQKNRWIISKNLIPWFCMIIGISPLLLSYSHWILSEIPFLCISLLSIYFFYRYREEKRNYCFWIGFMLSILGFYTRSIGISLIGAFMLYSIFSKKYKQFGLTFLSCIIIVFPWFLRSIFLAKNSTSYSTIFLLGNPYDPSQGNLTLINLAYRILFNGKIYCSSVIGASFFDIRSKNIGIWVGMICLFFIIAGVWKGKYLKDRFLFFYFFLYFVILFLWPKEWANERFLIPLFPFLFVYFYEGIVFTINYLVKKKRSLITAKVSLIIIGLIYFLHLFISLPSKWEKNLDYLKGNALAPYPPGPSNYFQAALWAKEHIPKDAVFMTRKPNMFYYFSKHKSISYPLTQDSLEFQRSLEKNKVQYIVFNSSFIWDPVYLGPFIVANQNRMRVILKTSHPEVHLIEYLQDIDSS